MAASCAVPPDDPFAVCRSLYDVLAAELAGPVHALSLTLLSGAEAATRT